VSLLRAASRHDRDAGRNRHE